MPNPWESGGGLEQSRYGGVLRWESWVQPPLVSWSLTSSGSLQCEGLDQKGYFWPSVSWDLGLICKKVLEYLPVTRTAICPLRL